MMGAVGFYTILAGAVVVLFAVFLGAVFIWPLILSGYRRYPGILFPRASLRVQTLCEGVRANGWRWLVRHVVRNQRSLLTYWSFVWVLPLGFLVVAAVATLDLPVGARVRPDLIQHGWQAQLTITSLSFIVLIFLLEQISRTQYREGVIQEFFASSRIMPVIYFTLAASGLVAYFHFVQPAESMAALIDATFIIFIGTILGIGYIYYRVARLIFFDPLDEMTVEQVQRGIDQQLREQERQATAERLLEEQLPACVGIGVNRDRRIYMAQELGLEGYIADINLAKMAAVCRKYADRFDGTDNPTLLLNVGLGDELQAGVDVVSVTDTTMHPDEIPDGFAEELATAIHCSRKRPWKTGDQLIERNLGRIGEDTRDAINSLNPTRLEKHLGFYVDLLQYATRLNRDVAADYGRTPAPIADLVDYIYREFYHLLEAAARTGSTDLINTVRGEIFRLSLAYHRQGENYLFEKSIGLYASFYRVLAASPATDPERVHGLLSSMDDVQTMLTADLDRARTVAEVDHVETDLESFYAVLERMLQGAIEEGDARTFNDVWNLGADDFVLVRPESGIYGLQRQIDRAADEAERERLEQELAVKRRQQEVVESIQDAFEETRFVAAAWAYREVREGDFAEPVFREMFSESIKGYSFGTLAEVYLRLCTNPRLDLFRWESEDADVFKGVRMSRPAAHTWLQEFFCAMGLLLLDPDEYTGEDVGEPDNPLATIEIERRSYPDFADMIEAVAAEDLARTGVADAELEDLEEKKAVFLALHYQMEERLERREEDQVIDAPLDQDKVADFEERYVSTFTDQFVFRQVLDDLGWLDVQPYNEEIDDRGAGFDVFYPKGGFIPDPPAEFIHHLDQRVWNHIDFILQTWLDAAQDHLAETRIDAYDGLPDELAKVCCELAEDGRSPRAIIMGGFRATNVLTDSDNLNTDHQPSDEVIGGFSYNDTMIPVYKDSGSEFDALVLAGSEQPVELTEYRRDEAPVFVKIEKVTRQLLKDLDPEGFDELSDEDIREKLQCVRFRALYYAQFDTSGTFGTTFIVAE